MKICIPIEKENGLESLVHWHFGSAPFFMIYDTDLKTYNVIDNRDRMHQEGHCNPLSTFAQTPIDMLIVANIGPRALQRLKDRNIKVMSIETEGKISDVILALEKGVLKEMKDTEACTHHHGCN